MKKRLDIDKRTIAAMISIYCSSKHNNNSHLCLLCKDLYEYASERIDKCLFGNKKPVCKNCKVHCYKPEMRQKIKEVMRISGPKMIWKHPVLAIIHLVKK